MKNTLAISLILLLGWPTMLRMVVFVNWQANRDYIAQNLCENRQDPESDCDGNCQLVKEVKKTSESSSPLIPVKTIEKIHLEVFDCNTSTIEMPQLIKEIQTVFSFNVQIINPLFSKAFFHPPEVI